MGNGENNICVKIADVPVKIRCKYKENFEFLFPYASDDEPAFTVEVTEEEFD